MCVRQQRAPGFCSRGDTDVAGEVLYPVLARMLDAAVWGGDLVGRENLPRGEAFIVVGNHAGALGPIAITSSIPRRLWPWVIHEMLEWDAAAAYLCEDFV